jgi:thiamine biosynthesis lipoprotein ApbE
VGRDPDLIAYVSERIIEKVDEETLSSAIPINRGLQILKDAENSDPISGLDKIIQEAINDRTITANLPSGIQELVKRRAAEIYREKRLNSSQTAISRIDVARSQKLIAMSAPLISEMATALRRSADTLESV